VGVESRCGEGLGGAHLTWEGPTPNIKGQNKGLG